MEIWLDTVNLEMIREANAMGILSGITTNPSIIAKSGKPREEILESLLHVQEGPITAQVTEALSQDMVKEGRDLYSISSRIIVKVPVTKEGLKTMNILSQEEIPVMGTIIFNPLQVLLAVQAGACYVAPYFGRIQEAGKEAGDILRVIMQMLEHYKLSCKLLAASIRSATQVEQCLEIGAHAITLGEKAFLEVVTDDSLTLENLERFSQDAKKGCR